MHPEKVFLFNSSLPENLPGIERKIKEIINGNIGNTYISYAVLKILFGGPVKVAHLPNAWTDPLPQSLADRINRDYSHFIFIMQDFIREDFRTLPFERVNNFLEKIKIPVVPISLCANSFNGYDPTLVSRIDKEQRRFLSLVSEKSALIGVRGRYTAEVLDQLGIKNVWITGCPSFFESGESRTIVKRPWDPEGVVTTGAYFNVKAPNSVHVLQDEAYFIDVLFLCGEEDLSDTRRLARPIYEFDMPFSLHLHLKARQGLLGFFTDIEEWKKFYENHNRCLTVGTRLHSAIFSCNRGVPAIVTNVDSRARETCEHLGIPYMPDLVPNSDIAEIFEMLDLSPMNLKYPSLYTDFIKYLDIHGLQQSPCMNKAEYFQFPHIEKPAAQQSLQALDKGFHELARFCEEKVRQCRDTEKIRQLMEDALMKLQTAENRLKVAEEAISKLQIAESRLKVAEDALMKLQTAEATLPIAKDCTQEPENSRPGKAGRIAAILRLLPKALHPGALRLRILGDSKEKEKDAA
jgi:hypothetical protein